MIQSLNPKSESYVDGQKVLNSLKMMLEQEEKTKIKEDPDYVPKKKMTYQ